MATSSAFPGSRPKLFHMIRRWRRRGWRIRRRGWRIQRRGWRIRRRAPRIVVRADWGALGRRASRCTDVARFAAALRRSLGGHTAERGVADLLVDVPVGRGDVRGQPGHVFAQLLHGVCHLVHPVARLELVRHHQVHVHHGGAFDMRLHGLARTRVRAPHLAVRARDDGSWARGPVGAHIGAADLVTARALLCVAREHALERACRPAVFAHDIRGEYGVAAQGA
mmetsp:Transcript_40265/g.92539  ORF Transcript_40265/g.92539 Transcript_40265/m.92539 type:complete len:224 (-) Transcript_40265:272-943(-)